MDYDRLRRDIEDYYGTAMHGGFPIAMMNLVDVGMMSDTELVSEGESIGLNMDEYSLYDDDYDNDDWF